MRRSCSSFVGLPSRHARNVLVLAAFITLGIAVGAVLLARDTGTVSPGPVTAALEPAPEGPIFRLSRDDPQWSELSLPSRFPQSLPQTCTVGLNVVVTFADRTRIAYGPCKRPSVIELLERLTKRGSSAWTANAVASPSLERMVRRWRSRC